MLIIHCSSPLLTHFWFLQILVGLMKTIALLLLQFLVGTALPFLDLPEELLMDVNKAYVNALMRAERCAILSSQSAPHYQCHRRPGVAKNVTME